MNRHNDLIDSLAQDVTPRARPMPVALQAASWWLAGVLYVVTVTALLGPLRPGAFEQLVAEPRFLVETLLGLFGIGAVAMAVIASSIPGRPVRRWVWIAAVALGAWLLNIVSGFMAPTLELGMSGKRPHCFAETLIYALPPMLAALFMVRRLYPLSPMSTGIGAGLAGGLLPAWFMQLACMYEPFHILTHHVMPGLLMMLVAALLSWVFLRGKA